MTVRSTREGFVQGPKGIRLYYRVDGERGPWLVCCNGIGVSMAFWEPFARRMSGEYRVVRWDCRAHGRSDDPKDPFDIGIHTCVDDLEAVIAGLRIERPVLLGHSMGGQFSFEYYRRHPGKVAALVPTLCTSGRAVETFFDTRLSVTGLVAAEALVRRLPGLATRIVRPVFLSGLAETIARAARIVDPELAPRELMRPYVEQFARMDMRSYLTLAMSMQAHDASEVLPTIAVPTLVVAGDKDLFTPFRLSSALARKIPGAELLVIPNGTHAALIEQPDLLALRVAKFLDERVFPERKRAAG